MLSISEFFVGTIGEAPAGSLVLPRSKYDRAAIVGICEEVPFIVFLDGHGRFHGFPSSHNDNYKGLIIPDINVEIDETSVIDTGRRDAAAGSIFCNKGNAGVLALGEKSPYNGLSFVRLAALRLSSDVEAAFSNWQVTLGIGSEKRVLWRVNTAHKVG